MSIFQKTIQPSIDFSTFPLGRSTLLSANFGELVPCFLQEVLPNDRFKVRGMSSIQFAPMVSPMMQDVYVSFHYFYVPDRLLYKYWESAFTGSRDGRQLNEDEVPAMPGLTAFESLTVRAVSGEHSIYLDTNSIVNSRNIGHLADYLGYPSNEGAVIRDFISDLPLRGYFKIWYDWYRDENLQYKNDFIEGNVWYKPADYYTAWDQWYSNANGRNAMTAMAYCLCDGNNSYREGYQTTLDLKYRSYKKDYFTACLPSPQKGEPITISLGDSAPVVGDLSGSNWLLGNESNALAVGVSGGLTSASILNVVPGGSTGIGDMVAGESDVQSISGSTINIDQTTGLTVNLQEATAITINELRTAFALQRILEAMSVSGSRYNEYLLSQYGTAPDDLRLQRPQFLGGWTQKVAVQQVIQTGGDQSGEGANFMNQPGYAAGRMFSAGQDFIFSDTFKEPGYIFGIMSVMPKAGYFQGLPRHLSRSHRFDYYNPKFAYLGEQAVKNKELYYTGTDSDDGTFGYMQRWAEYRTSYDTIHGDFKTSLKYMHMYREFDSVPTLSEDFILTKDVDTRPFVLWQSQTSVNKLIWANLYHEVNSSRPLPYNPMPGIHG